MERLSSAPLRKTGAIPTVNHGTDMNTSTANLHDTATGTEPAPSALVIDDDELYRHLARAMLESLGWSVETASDGRVGWQMAQLHDFDLVICDIVMPHQDGFETIGKIHRYKPTLPVIAMSGGGLLQSRMYIEMARLLGASAALSKPFSHNELRETLAKLPCPHPAPEAGRSETSSRSADAASR